LLRLIPLDGCRAVAFEPTPTRIKEGDEMRFRLSSLAAAMLLSAATSANAAAIHFATDPFAGTDALTTPGRQIIGNELFIPVLDIAADVFVFDAAVFGITDIHFANDVIANIPTSGVNTVVLRTFDNDADPATPFGAGSAATLIADQITSAGAGFFIYFNSGLDLARLVYSTDLSDNTADLKILARFENLAGQAGRDAMANFTAANFAITAVPEPTTSVLLALGAGWTIRRARHRLRRQA
jgi:hypothetical protein